MWGCKDTRSRSLSPPGFGSYHSTSPQQSPPVSAPRKSGTFNPSNTPEKRQEEHHMYTESDTSSVITSVIQSLTLFPSLGETGWFHFELSNHAWQWVKHESMNQLQLVLSSTAVRPPTISFLNSAYTIQTDKLKHIWCCFSSQITTQE